MRNSKVIITASIIIVVTAVYIIFYTRLLQQLKAKKCECAAMESGLADNRNILKLFGHAENGPVMMTEKEMPIAIDELTNHGKAMGIIFHSIKPREVIPPGVPQGAGSRPGATEGGIKGAQPYKILPVEMKLAATDKQFSDFMGSLDALKKSLIRVESFDVVPVEKDKAAVKGTVVIDIYFASEDTAA